MPERHLEFDLVTDLPGAPLSPSEAPHWKTTFEVLGAGLGAAGALIGLLKVFARKKPEPPAGQTQTATGDGNLLVQAAEGGSVQVTFTLPPAAAAEPSSLPLELSPVEIRLVRVAGEHGGLLPLMQENVCGRRGYVGPFGEECLEIDRELEHMVALGILRREPSSSMTIKYRLTDSGFRQLEGLKVATIDGRPNA